MKKYYISACGKKIFIRNETKEHLLAHPDVVNFLDEAISKIYINRNVKHFEKAVDFERVLGASSLVRTKKIAPEDEADFAFRIKRRWPTRVALDSKDQTCNSATLVINLDEKIHEYYLVTAYIGLPCPDEPCYITNRSSSEFREAIDFWCKHALIYNPKAMGKSFKSNWMKILQLV
jgi:hypothetical protein